MTMPAKSQNGATAPWTDEHVAELRKLAAEGKDGAQIAKAMQKMRPGVTRNSVISARHRYGIASCSGARGGMSRLAKAANAKASAKLKAAPRPKPKPAAALKPSRPIALAPEISAPEPAPPASTWAPLAGTTPRNVVNHEAGQCLWPVDGERGETLFCCAPQRGDGPYCAAHRRTAYVRVKRRAA